MTTGERWRLGRRPALDGLRGVAVALVVTAHATEAYWPDALPNSGRAGVYVFFALSGFLITTLLLEERERGGIDLPRFFLRRARRLLPALAALLVFLVALGVVSLGAVAAVSLYYGNWYLASGARGLQWAPHTWSLAIEEQFYLLWPLVLILARSRRVLLGVALGGAVVSMTTRALLWDGTTETASRLSWWTHTQADAILLGCALAVVMHGSRVRVRGHWLPVVAVVGVALVQAGEWWTGVALPTVAACAALWAIVAATSEAPPRVLTVRPLVRLGQRSYGVYLWHIPALGVSHWFGLPPLAFVVAALSLTAAATWASWRYIERPFLSGRGDRARGDADRSAARDRGAVQVQLST